MKAIIIDDEPKARKLLQVLLEENCPAVDDIYQAGDLLAGVECIKQERPQIVFLDIEMPQHSGLEIVDFLDREELNFEIIFTTAYSEYAIQAFELSAVDYILKPLRPSKVVDAVEKAMASLGKSQVHVKLEELKAILSSSQFKKIALPVAEGIRFVEFDKIIMLEANGMYTKISMIDEEILISKPLKHFVELLQKAPTFYKPHRSYLINLAFIKQYVKSDGGYILMDNDRAVSISKDKKDEFLSIVQSL
ncbi:LytTR family DNA-binding domain-containing protein [Aureisphaera galaxeae]|uniref:LytR/AlgR family response regulator transcription factor n=1 Tax=Aureisphaera galaxeae TaxID=1538023 RepID=UPI0023507410|nr:LytTR family DNA-binding domain-containing protein [Aureisphaera galaxeae]MDC8005185.1 LytTR family DNA-binding domain-containing protein [Aureisphaera galaxeae]